MMYLEDFVKTLESKADVLVYLDSYTTVVGITCHDSCGNHWAKSFYEAIMKKNLQKTFLIKDSSFDAEKNQWTVNLENKKSESARTLDNTAMSISRKHYFDDYYHVVW